MIAILGPMKKRVVDCLRAVHGRFVGWTKPSTRREYLDHLLIRHERQLYRVLRAYCAYVNQARPHQGIGQAIPATAGQATTVHAGVSIVSVPILSGLHHDYQRAA